MAIAQRIAEAETKPAWILKVPSGGDAPCVMDNA
jgi:hypothetical protein